MKRLIARVVIYLFAQTFNATGYRAGGVLSPPKRQERTMPTEDLATLLNEFQGAYGRLCLLTCQALASGADRAMVQKAFSGDSFSHATKIVDAYRRCDVALKAAQLCGETAIVERAHATRRAIEGEWMVEIDPRVSAHV